MSTRKKLHFELLIVVTGVEKRARKEHYMLAFFISAPESESLYPALLSAKQLFPLFPLETPQLIRDMKKGYKATHSTKIWHHRAPRLLIWTQQDYSSFHLKGPMSTFTMSGFAHPSKQHSLSQAIFANQHSPSQAIFATKTLLLRW